MITSKEFWIDVAIMVVVFSMVVTAIVLVSGCSNHKMTERVKFYDDHIEWESTVEQNLFLYVSKARQIYRHTPFTLTEIGELLNKPDPNSVDAISEGAMDSLLNFGL